MVAGSKKYLFVAKKFLHVGCGAKAKDQTTSGFNTDEWSEVRLDIDPLGSPDILGSMTDMKEVKDCQMDAVFSSHNIEHLFANEVNIALCEFLRVLNEDGFAVVTCPDLKAICSLVAEDKLLSPIYTSPAGDVTPLDIIYGFRPSLAAGRSYMAHRCGFTEKVLRGELRAAGFKSLASASSWSAIL